MLSVVLGGKLTEITGKENELAFWKSYSTLDQGTVIDHMCNKLTQQGFSGHPADMFRSWIAKQSGSTGTMGDQVRALFNKPAANWFA